MSLKSKSEEIRQQILDRLKFTVLDLYVRSKGFYLGLHYSLMYGQPPILVCKEEPENSEKPTRQMVVAALNPGECIDALDDLPDDSFLYEPFSVHQLRRARLSQPLDEAMERADIAMQKIEEYRPRRPITPIGAGASG